jgi:hypothetical protein
MAIPTVPPTSTATGTATSTPAPAPTATRCRVAGPVCHADLTLVPDGGETGEVLVALGTTITGPCAVSSAGNCIQFTATATGLAVQGQLVGLRPGDHPTLRLPVADTGGAPQRLLDLVCSVAGSDGRSTCDGIVGQPAICVALGAIMQVRANRPALAPSATATPLPTATLVPSPTPTRTPMPFLTATALTPAPTAPATPTGTAGLTATATATPGPSATSTATPTRTPTASPSPAPSPTARPAPGPACTAAGSICRANLTPVSPEVDRGPAERGACTANALNCIEIANTGAGILIQGIVELSGPPSSTAVVRIPVVDTSGRPLGLREIVCPAASTPGRYVCNALIVESGIAVQVAGAVEAHLTINPALPAPTAAPRPSATSTPPIPPMVALVGSRPAPLLPPVGPLPGPAVPPIPPPVVAPLLTGPPFVVPPYGAWQPEVPLVPEGDSLLLLLAGVGAWSALAAWRARRDRP